MSEDQPVLAALGRFHLSGEPLRGEWERRIAQWRGAVAGRFRDRSEFHGHQGSQTLYRYPPVQYRWMDGALALWAMGEAAAAVMNHLWPGAVLRLGEEERTVIEVEWSPMRLVLEPSMRLLRYRFGAPWLPLSQENHRRFMGLDEAGQRAELDRILVGNLLSLFKGLGWFLAPGQLLYAAVEAPRRETCHLKGVPLLGIRASFVTNFVLPAGLAVGRSVSHGFGWFVPLDPAQGTPQRPPSGPIVPSP